MKKILIIMLAMMLCGCKSTVSVKSEYKDGYTMAQGAMPDVSEIVEADEEATLSQELVGNKIVVTALKNGKDSVVEIPVVHEAIVVDGTTMKVDMGNYFSDSEMASKASYSFEDELVITCDDISFSVPYTLAYPNYTIAEEIIIDTYTGYDINDFVKTDEGVEINSSLEGDVLTIVLEKNDWKVEETRTVTLVDSNPYPMIFEGYEVIDNPYCKETLVLYEDGTYDKKFDDVYSYSSKWEITGANTGIRYFNNSDQYETLEFNDDWSKLVATHCYRRMGGGLVQTAYTRVN